MSRRAGLGRRRPERGATFSEYALLASMVVVASIGAISLLQDESGSYLVDTGSDIGTPRELASDIDPDLPEPPSWLTQPPPPTTTTTAAPTTTTTASTTSSSSTSSSSATSTTAPSYPTGSVIHQGPMSSVSESTKCFQVKDPGIVGSEVEVNGCNGPDPTQELQTVGDPATVAIQFTEAINSGLCIADNGSTNVVMATCDGNDWQLFDVVDNGGSYTFVNRATGRCLRQGDNWLEVDACDSDSDQAFTF